MHADDFDIIQQTDGIEAVVNLGDITFCISLSTIDEFKRDLAALVTRHRI